MLSEILEKGDSVMGTGTGSDIRKCSKEFCSKYGCIAVHGVSCHMDQGFLYAG